MIQVTDENKVIIEGEDIVAEATRLSMLLLELTKKLNEKDPKVALSFLRVCHSMCNGLAKPIVDKLDEEADKRLQDKMAAKRAERVKKGEQLDGNTEQFDTSSGDATNSGEFDSIRSDKSATESGKESGNSTEKEVVSE